MRFIIDTSTWVSLVKYYKPFDNSSVIYDFFKKKIKDGEFILLSEVSTECSYVSKRIVTKELDFITNKKLITKTAELLPTKKFYNLLDNQFCNQNQKRLLSEVDIESLTNDFLKSADSKIILKAIEITKTLDNQITVVTEETSSNNDNKLYKKIPAVCKELNVNCIGLPKLIEGFNKEITVKIKNTSA
ncbi:DUF4411 family protein [Lutibacter flavus]|uniref:DUF4411 family protein n=1 Tax=Lutibacter flavus TaxID=691689 RepID=A0A238Y5B0_9FLAO|nr:DUF4411 family protein [Lutibacter flavus]SNR66200.1 protein of unknown function [Lutibacter flavus]